MFFTISNPQKASTTTLHKHRWIKGTLALATSLTLTVISNTAMADSSHSFTDYARVVRVEPLYRNVTVREPQRICRPAIQHNQYQYRPNHNYDRRTKKLGTRGHSGGEVFVAGVIGGAIGHAISRSVNGRPSVGATIAGAAIGSALANSAVSDNQRVSHHSTNTRHSQRHFTRIKNRHDRTHTRDLASENRRDRRHNRPHCTTTVQTRTERRHDGYNVTYRYHGHRYQTRTRHHPGDRLAINVTVSPHNH